jgi:tetratricopeptide (TPR) repeat protein
MRSTHRILSGLVIALGLVLGCASGPPPTPVELGEAALERGDWRAAKTHFAEALRLDAEQGRAWHGQARAQLRGRDPEGALRSLSSLARADAETFSGEARSTYTDSLEAVTRLRLDREQSEAAMVAVRALVDLDPERRGLARLLGSALVREAERRRLLGDRDSALALYREACRVVPQTLEAWVGAVEILLEAKKGREAVRLLEAARKVHPTAGAIRSLSLQALQLR